MKTKVIEFWDLTDKHFPMTQVELTFEEPIGLTKVILYGFDGNSRELEQDEWQEEVPEKWIKDILIEVQIIIPDEDI